MSIYVLDIPLTSEIIIAAFRRFVSCEARRRIDFLPEHQDGFESGYAFCLTDFFGNASEEENSDAYDEENSYIHVCARIIDSSKELRHKIEEMKSVEDSILYLQELENLIETVVTEYVSTHYEECLIAITHL